VKSDHSATPAVNTDLPPYRSARDPAANMSGSMTADDWTLTSGCGRCSASWTVFWQQC
jgi:hypothetical protein